MLPSFFRHLAGQPAPVLISVSEKDPLPTTPLRRLGTAVNLTVGAASSKTPLTSSCMAVSLNLVGCNARLRISTNGIDATVTDHRMLDGERIDLAVEPGSTIAVIGDGGTGTLAISELV